MDFPTRDYVPSGPGILCFYPDAHVHLSNAALTRAWFSWELAGCEAAGGVSFGGWPARIVRRNREIGVRTPYRCRNMTSERNGQRVRAGQVGLLMKAYRESFVPSVGQKGISQEELLRRMADVDANYSQRFSHTTVSRWESGTTRPTVERLRTFGKALNLSAEEVGGLLLLAGLDDGSPAESGGPETEEPDPAAASSSTEGQDLNP